MKQKQNFIREQQQMFKNSKFVVLSVRTQTRI